MLVQKLRLQRGWSQQQLAELSGLSVRTIQRIEQGSGATVETWKSLASVFEVDFQQLRGAPTMQATDPAEPHTGDSLAPPPDYRRKTMGLPAKVPPFVPSLPHSLAKPQKQCGERRELSTCAQQSQGPCFTERIILQS